MNLSSSQWWSAFVLDVLIKAALMYWQAALTTLGMIVLQGFEPLIPFILMAASLSSLHFLCLFFGNRFVGSLQAMNAQRSPVMKFVCVLISGNALFIVSFAAVLSVSGNVYERVLFSTMVAVTNLVPILLVAGTGGLLGLIKRLA
ncbi:hypothetical protein [Bradyrhizobium ivorense]|uniref:hypothetical protein n=1 Tax=Bradyrhizobium ivorense TaxID=2511166 RepID=UPI0010B8B517|nr:hypothetical protein [Bradyrhizobium ivorense]VIO77374.1 hypothetical protein CI41S_56290 [Bradyrhizobium ivorense]